jgi:CO/xanthine dehydrogenase Mo-binding subunit
MHGIGIAAAVDSHGQLSSAVGAVVHLTRDGKALIDTGQSYCGFSPISECHIVAETLGMNYEDVQLGSIGETDNSSEGGMEAGSTRTITLGAAFNMAAQDALDQAKIIAAGSTLLNVTADKISAVGGKFFETANPGNSKTWAEVAARLTNPIVGRGYTWPKKLRRQP